MHVRKMPGKIEVDLHGLMREDAAYRLSHLLTHAGPDIQEVVVIHGYTRGTALRDMVRKEFTHPRLKAKLPTLNEGTTRFLLKK